jgi:hypothetical protein
MPDGPFNSLDACLTYCASRAACSWVYFWPYERKCWAYSSQLGHDIKRNDLIDMYVKL